MYGWLLHLSAAKSNEHRNKVKQILVLLHIRNFIGLPCTQHHTTANTMQSAHANFSHTLTHTKRELNNRCSNQTIFHFIIVQNSLLCTSWQCSRVNEMRKKATVRQRISLFFDGQMKNCNTLWKIDISCVQLATWNVFQSCVALTSC